MPVRDLLNAASSQGSVSDPYFYDVSLLLNGDGTNGAQNNTFLDSSTNNFTITRNGNTTQGSFSPYGNLWSNYFNGSSYLNAPSNSGFAFGTGNFTVECWINASNVSSGYPLNNAYNSGGGDTQWGFGLSSGHVTFGGWFTNFLTSSNTIVPNTWNWLVVCRSGTTLSLFINGTRVDTTTNSQNFSSTNGAVLGATGNSANWYSGYISNARVVNGTDIYGATNTTITVPTVPATAISGTSFLTCQSNRFIDNSSNAFAITTSGSPSVQRFSPFNPTAPYSTATIGGSGYFDGSTAYLTAPSNSAFAFSGQYTVAFWAYLNATPTNYAPVFVVSTTNGMQIGFDTSNGNFGIARYGVAWDLTTSPFPKNQWIHVALTRDSSNVTRIFYNGVQQTSGTLSYSYPQAGVLIAGGNGGYLPAYVTDLQVLNGTCLYTTTFNPPTAPVTNITNTALLLNYTNAGIPDLAMQNDLQTVGSAQVSTSVVKYGTGSLSFSGGSDKLQIPYSPLYDTGAGNFTLEFWLYNASTSGFQAIYTWGSSGSNVNDGLWVYLNGTTLTGSLFSGGTEYSATTTLSTTNTWNHVAFVRNGTNIQIYFNGVGGSSGSFSGAPNVTTAYSLNIGNEPNNTTYPFTGYIDDLRITKGYARYTANFTPPTAALPTF